MRFYPGGTLLKVYYDVDKERTVKIANIYNKYYAVVRYLSLVWEDLLKDYPLREDVHRVVAGHGDEYKVVANRVSKDEWDVVEEIDGEIKSRVQLIMRRLK